MRQRYWYKLDNAAKIYPPTTNIKRQANFGLSATLTQKVDANILTQAVDEVLKRFPSYKTTLKRGVFWYYLEENVKPFKVYPMEEDYLCNIDDKKNNGYLFKVFYGDKTITMVVYHALGDGNGGLDVFKTLIFEYLKLSGKNVKTENVGIKSMNAPYVPSESADTFNSVYNAKCGKLKKEKLAFKTYGMPYGWDGNSETIGKVKVSELKAVAHKYDCTVTVLLSAIVLHSIYNGFIKDKKVKNKLVKALVPVNMRKIYPSETVRNFALFVRLCHDYETPISFEECVKECKEQLARELTKENMDKIVTSNVKNERNVFIKLVPLFIKDLVMKYIYTKVGDNLHTLNLSNLGVVTLPDSVSKYVTDIKFVLRPSYSSKTQMAVASYGDNCYIVITRCIVENYLEKEFFRMLSSLGVNVEIHSNYWEG